MTEGFPGEEAQRGVRTKGQEEVQRDKEAGWEHYHCFCTLNNGRVACCQCGFSLHAHNKTITKEKE